uniref:RING-type domain-containing protein n=1 Tax=Timspurckia oligopyrenoides TaxID=708627 RepID=A0A7S0ZBN2_9RHOD|mmetsp:Transcript_11406/g.20637  ORF Transcript_11406/g.20637 Transcript_11406/m.20637 type:complete len:196 (+) Transcript_11406:136-723(+)
MEHNTQVNHGTGAVSGALAVLIMYGSLSVILIVWILVWKVFEQIRKQALSAELRRRFPTCRFSDTFCASQLPYSTHHSPLHIQRETDDSPNVHVPLLPQQQQQQELRLPPQHYCSNDDDDQSRVETGTRILCVICLESFVPSDDVVILGCRHLFHSQCMFRWATEHLSCPLCRCSACSNCNNNNNHSPNPISNRM